MKQYFVNIIQGKAIDLSKKSLAAMMPALYGDHLNG